MGSHVHGHSIHGNTVASWREFDAATRADKVLALYDHAGTPLSDRECCQRLGFDDMNCVRPSITTLVDRRRLFEVDTVRCPVTDRHVRRCAITANFLQALAWGQQQVIDELTAASVYGLTCAEIEEWLRMSHGFAQSRLEELVDAGRIIDSKRTRGTQRGHPATVWILIELAGAPS